MTGNEYRTLLLTSFFSGWNCGSTPVVVLPSLWFQRTDFFDSHLYCHVFLWIFVDPSSGIDFKKHCSFLWLEMSTELCDLTSLINGWNRGSTHLCNIAPQFVVEWRGVFDFHVNHHVLLGVVLHPWWGTDFKRIRICIAMCSYICIAMCFYICIAMCSYTFSWFLGQELILSNRGRFLWLEMNTELCHFLP